MSDITLEKESNGTEMKKPAELWQVVLGFVALLLSLWGCIAMYTDGIKRDSAQSAAQVENHEQRIKQLESDRAELKQDIKEIKESQQQVLIILQNKQDRK